MESKSRNILEVLKDSPKGQLKYDTNWAQKGRIEKVIEQCTSPPVISISPRTSSTPKSPQKTSIRLRPSVSPVSVGDEVNDDKASQKRTYDEDSVELQRQRLAKTLYNVENEVKLKVMAAVEAQRRKFEEHTQRLWQETEQKLIELMISREDDRQSQIKEVKDHDLSFSEEANYTQRQLRQDHKRHAKRQEAIHQEAQRKEKEEAARKQQMAEEEKKHLEEMLTHQKQLAATHTYITKTISQSPHAQYFAESIHKCPSIMEQMRNKVESELLVASQSGATAARVLLVREVCATANDVLKFVKTQEEMAKKKAEEMAAQQEKEKKEQEAATAAAAAAKVAAAASPSHTGTPQQSTDKSDLQKVVSGLSPQDSRALGASPQSIIEYKRLQDFLSAAHQQMSDLSTDPKNKKIKFDLQKAVNIPVNAISPTSGSHLRDKLQRICNLLEGQTVTAGGQRVSVSQHPMGATFCKDLLAKKIVKQGDEQVSSNADSAFAIAAVTVGVWCRHADVGDLLLAHLHRACPYTVPMYHPKTEGQSSQEYYELLGYQYSENGEREKQDKFLKRMTGLMRLYAALIVSLPPPGTSNPHPHGLQHGWAWLARVMNLDPRPDITATALYEFLQVAGSSLLKQYGRQFVKLIGVLITDFLPRIQAVTPEGAGGPVTRLEIFLKKIYSNKSIDPPEGFLSSNFWFT